MSSSNQADIEAARERLRAKMGPASGHKGVARNTVAMRRPVNTGAQTNAADSLGERAKSALKKLGMQAITPVNEVVLRKSDGTSLVFSSPKVSIAPHSNTTHIIGNPVVKKEADTEVNMLDLLNKIRQMPAPTQQQLQQNQDADQIPTLVEDFDAIATKDAEDKNKEAKPIEATLD